jgi:hypothetical protein
MRTIENKTYFSKLFFCKKKKLFFSGPAHKKYRPNGPAQKDTVVFLDVFFRPVPYWNTGLVDLSDSPADFEGSTKAPQMVFSLDYKISP